MSDLFSQPPLGIPTKPTESRVVSARDIDMEHAARLRDTAMLIVAVNSGEEFQRLARAFIPTYLAEHGPMSGEDLTDACKAADIIPHNDKAFGPVYGSLSRAGIIEKDMSEPPGPRRKGHASGIAWRWKLKSSPIAEAYKNECLGMPHTDNL